MGKKISGTAHTHHAHKAQETKKTPPKGLLKGRDKVTAVARSLIEKAAAAAKPPEYSNHAPHRAKTIHKAIRGKLPELPM